MEKAPDQLFDFSHAVLEIEQGVKLTDTYSGWDALLSSLDVFR